MNTRMARRVPLWTNDSWDYKGSSARIRCCCEGNVERDERWMFNATNLPIFEQNKPHSFLRMTLDLFVGPHEPHSTWLMMTSMRSQILGRGVDLELNGSCYSHSRST